MVNPATGTYFALADLAVGSYVTIKAHPLLITRADEHALQWTEAHPEIFPYADPMLCASRLEPVLNMPEFSDPAGIDPDALKDLALSAGVDIIDHEIITLLRFFGVEDVETTPRISGEKILAALQ